MPVNKLERSSEVDDVFDEETSLSIENTRKKKKKRNRFSFHSLSRAMKQKKKRGATTVVSIELTPVLKDKTTIEKDVNANNERSENPFHYEDDVFEAHAKESSPNNSFDSDYQRQKNPFHSTSQDENITEVNHFGHFVVFSFFIVFNF